MEEVYQRNRQNSGQPRNMKSLRSGNSSHDTKQGVVLLEPGRVTVQGTEDSSDARSPLPNKRPKVAAPSLQAPPSTSRATPRASQSTRTQKVHALKNRSSSGGTQPAPLSS
jgi:hypothetical protein